MTPTDARSDAVLDIEGMTCASCVARVEKRLTRVEGVDATVNLATETARVSFPSALDPDELVQAVRAAGYDAVVRPRTVPAEGPTSPGLTTRTITATSPGARHCEPG